MHYPWKGRVIACEGTKQEVSPSVIHFAGTGKDDPVYAKFVDDVRTLVPATCWGW